ncbi:MAG: MFS transporter [Chloroflexi bacterium]|nr:MFS transporter [Chloroflexota bacterium]
MATEEAQHRRTVNAWCMYDWANSAFATTIMAAMLPPYFSGVAAASLAKDRATSIWGLSIAFATLLVAVLGPILGAIADQTGSKKRFMRAFLTVAVIFTGLLFFIQEGDWLMAIIFYILASVGNAGANVFYDSLLPHVAKPEEIDQVSTKGFALGYLGGGILLAINLLWYLKPEWFGWMGITDKNMAVRVSFLSVAVWWVIFSIPLFRYVREPRTALREKVGNPVRAGFTQLKETLRNIRQYKELAKFLLAFWLYADGIGTIIKMATIYGAEIGIGSGDLAGALLLTQVVGVPFSFLFGWMAKRIGAKRSIYIALIIYTLISIAGYFMSQAWHFWVLAGAVGLVQGGSQALSRSLFGSMSPKARSAEFFGFYDISSKFAGVFGPLLFSAVALIFRTSRIGIVSLVIFFVVGAWILSRVDEKAGIAVAQAEDERELAKQTAALQ